MLTRSKRRSPGTPIVSLLSILFTPACAVQETPSRSRASQDPGYPFQIEPSDPARATSTIATLDAYDVKHSGARFPSDVLRILPGMEVNRTTSTGSNVSLRGYFDASTASQGIMALIDGRQVYNEFLGGPLWDALAVSLDDIDRIEVIRGPGSHRYGPNAMHGLVNIVTKSPLDYLRDHVSFSSALGSYGSSRARFKYVKRDIEDGSALKALLEWDDISEFPNTDENAKDKLFGEIRFDKEFGTDQWLSLSAGHSDQKQDLLIPSVPPIRPALFINSIREGYVKANYTAGKFKAQVSWTGFDSLSEPDRFYGGFRTNLDTVDVDLQHTFPLLDQHTLTAGTGYHYSTASTRDPDVTGGRHSTDLAWIFLQDELEILETLFLTAGLRVDRHSIVGDNIAPRVALVWELAKQQSLRAAWGVGYRNPSLRELWFMLPVNVPGLPPLSIDGNLNLAAEEIRSFELGYFGAADDEPFKLGANLYYNLIDKLVSFVQDPVDLTRVAPQNQNDEKAYGVELEGAYDLYDRKDSATRHESSSSVFANVSYGEREARGSRGRRNRLAPRIKSNVGFRWANGTGVHSMLWVHYFDSIELRGMRVGDFVDVNGSLAYDFWLRENQVKGSVFVQGTNLLDNDHKEHPEGQMFGRMLMAGFKATF